MFGKRTSDFTSVSLNPSCQPSRRPSTGPRTDDMLDLCSSRITVALEDALSTAVSPAFRRRTTHTNLAWQDVSHTLVDGLVPLQQFVAVRRMPVLCGRRERLKACTKLLAPNIEAIVLRSTGSPFSSTSADLLSLIASFRCADLAGKPRRLDDQVYCTILRSRSREQKLNILGCGTEAEPLEREKEVEEAEKAEESKTEKQQKQHKKKKKKQKKEQQKKKQKKQQKSRRSKNRRRSSKKKQKHKKKKQQKEEKTQKKKQKKQKRKKHKKLAKETDQNRPGQNRTGRRQTKKAQNPEHVVQT